MYYDIFEINISEKKNVSTREVIYIKKVNEEGGTTEIYLFEIDQI